ncbi:MAG TPA: hypothetical protein PLE74_04355 [Candidatus Cloacimonadota bacterium]|nr:hypothetical protein [Candidatus Cloacimonadota bacterium]HPT71491.1 hypothetical protein [Candidatus Cloacimonadota bacterium]
MSSIDNQSDSIQKTVRIDANQAYSNGFDGSNSFHNVKRGW